MLSAIAIGIVGSLIGILLLSRLGIHLVSDFLTKIVVATIGAVLLLLCGRDSQRGAREGATGAFDVKLLSAPVGRWRQRNNALLDPRG